MGKANDADCFHSEDMTTNLKWSEPPSSKPAVFPKSIHSHSLLHMPLFLKHSGTLFQVPTLSRFIEEYRCNQKRISTSSTHPLTLVYICSNNLYFPFFTVWMTGLWAQGQFPPLCTRPAISPHIRDSSSNFSIFFALSVFSLLRNDSHQNQKDASLWPGLGGISLCDFSSFELCPISLLPFIAKFRGKKSCL